MAHENEYTTTTYWVCIDCHMAHATGELGDDAETSMEDTWNLIEDGQTVTMGQMAEGHACGRENGEEIEECECDQDDFSKSPCDGCGQTLAGYRFAYTVWTPND